MSPGVVELAASYADEYQDQISRTTPGLGRACWAGDEFSRPGR
jgi:hypothetical protein